MLEDLTADSVYAAIIMQEPPPRAVLLVEGQDDDMILGDHVRSGVVAIVCGSRRTVVGAVEIASGQGRSEVFGLVDRDLVPEVAGDERLPENVVTTTSYDLTADIATARPGSLKMAAHSLAHVESRIVTEVRGHDIEEAIIETASAFAGVRIAVKRAGHPVRLEGFDFSKVLDQQFRLRDIEAIAENLRIVKPKDFAWDEEILDDLRTAMEATVGIRELCGGHDLASVAYGFVTAAGGKNFSKNAFEAAIRVHATCELLGMLACVARLHQLCFAATGIKMFDCGFD